MVYGKNTTYSTIMSSDVHSENVARKLGLMKRNKWMQKLNELDKSLRKLDKNDPVKYDFALFGLQGI